MTDRTALTVIEGEARISCRRIREALGFALTQHLHRLIEAHRDELEDFGEVFLRVQKNPSLKGGRPTKTYLLNEHQATAICLWAETPKARAGRKLIIEVFTAWRRGQLPAVSAPAHDPFAAMAGRARHVADHLIAVGSLDDLAMRATHLPIWSNGQRPPWWSNIELRRFLTAAHRQMTLQDCRDKAVQTFGVGVPSISSIQRYWARLDTAVGPTPSKKEAA